MSSSARRSPGPHDEWPIDPDVDVDEDARHRRHPPEPPPARPPWPHFRPAVVATVFAGGCAGGLLRYSVTQHWPTADGRIPWPTFTVNIAGAFVLAVLIVLVTDLQRGSTYLRPLIGAGFCGALTTFASVVVTVDELIAHGHARGAATYLVASIVAGLVAAWIGLQLARSYAATRAPRRDI